MKIEFYNYWKQLEKGFWYIIFFEVSGGFNDRASFLGLTILNFEFNIFFLKKR